jgi:hypothetical protein
MSSRSTSVSLVFASLLACSPPGGDASTGAEQEVNASAPEPQSLPPGYESRTADEKLRLLWNDRILPTQYTTTLPGWPFVGFRVLTKATVTDLDVSMERISDEMPAGRARVVHSIGSVVQVELIADPSSPFTGMFKGGVGVARLSLAREPGADGFVPGIAVKLLADGQPSRNILAMFTIDGQGTNFYFFANTFSNVIPDPQSIGGKLVASIFSRASTTPGHLDVSDVATLDRRGRAALAPLAPAQLFFVPAPSVKAVPRKSSPEVDFRLDLSAIPDGTTLYEVHGSRALGEPPTRVGKLITRSPVTVSRFGDEKLFFKHERQAGTKPVPMPEMTETGGGGGGS